MTENAARANPDSVSNTRASTHIDHSQETQPQYVVKPYRWSEIFSLVPEYDGNLIFLNTFIDSCDSAHNVAVGNQR